MFLDFFNFSVDISENFLKQEVGTKLFKFDCSLSQEITKQDGRVLPNGRQDVASDGLRTKCITKELWEKYPVNPEILNFNDCGIKYHNSETFNGATIDMGFDEFVSRVGSLCTCGKLVATPLSGIDDELLADYQCYSQCIMCKASCIRKVLNHQVFPDPTFANGFYDFYVKFYKEKFAEAIKKWFFVTPKAVFAGIKSYEKQLEVLPAYLTNQFEALDMDIKPYYEQHNKSEDQSVGDKVRQICNPNKESKWFTLLFEKPLTSLMYHVFGHDYAVGFSNAEKSYVLNHMLHSSKNVTLDCTAFDNSHNELIKQPWFDLIDMTVQYASDEISKYMDVNVYKREFCKKKSLVQYYVRVDKKKVLYCTLDLGSRLASGSVYTTALNTYLMNLLVKYSSYKVKLMMRNVNSISGDDVSATYPEETPDETISEGLYRVFETPDEQGIYASGIKLKYDMKSTDPEDANPCSLDIFDCPKCGIRAVRTLPKYIRNSFVSIAYQTKNYSSKIPIEYFEQLIYEGERNWIQGLDFPTFVMKPLDHGIPVAEVSRVVMEAVKNRVAAKLQPDIPSNLLELVQKINSAETSEQDKVNALMGILTDSKFQKEREMHYCEKCNEAYNTFLCKQYNIIPELIMQKKQLPIRRVINGVLVDSKYTSYIPSELVTQAINYREERNKSLRTDLKSNIRKYRRMVYQDTLEVLPEKNIKLLQSYTGFKGDTLLDYLTDLGEKVNSKPPTTGLVQYIFENKLQPLLFLYYDVTLSNNFKDYVRLYNNWDFVKFYKEKKNTYYDFKVNYYYPPGKQKCTARFHLFEPKHPLTISNTIKSSSDSKFLKEYMAVQRQIRSDKDFERKFYAQKIKKGVFGDFISIIENHHVAGYDTDLDDRITDILSSFEELKKQSVIDPCLNRLYSINLSRIQTELMLSGKKHEIVDEAVSYLSQKRKELLVKY